MNPWRTQRASPCWRRQSKQPEHHTRQRSHEPSSAAQCFFWKKSPACWSCSLCASAELYLSPWLNIYGLSVTTHSFNCLFFDFLSQKNQTTETPRKRKTTQKMNWWTGRLLIYIQKGKKYSYNLMGILIYAKFLLIAKYVKVPEKVYVLVTSSTDFWFDDR